MSSSENQGCISSNTRRFGNSKSAAFPQSPCSAPSDARATMDDDLSELARLTMADGHGDGLRAHDATTNAVVNANKENARPISGRKTWRRKFAAKKEPASSPGNDRAGPKKSLGKATSKKGKQSKAVVVELSSQKTSVAPVDHGLPSILPSADFDPTDTVVLCSKSNRKIRQNKNKKYLRHKSRTKKVAAEQGDFPSDNSGGLGGCPYVIGPYVGSWYAPPNTPCVSYYPYIPCDPSWRPEEGSTPPSANGDGYYSPVALTAPDRVMHYALQGEPESLSLGPEYPAYPAYYTYASYDSPCAHSHTVEIPSHARDDGRRATLNVDAPAFKPGKKHWP